MKPISVTLDLGLEAREMTQEQRILWKAASAREIREDCLVLRQFKDRYGVCVIPPEQAKAAEEFVASIGREVTGVSGSKRGDLIFEFIPALSLEEIEALTE